MRDSNSGTHAQPRTHPLLTGFRVLWEKATRTTSTGIDDARREYITKVICLIIGLIAFTFFIVFFIGWLLDHVPVDSAAITLGFSLLLLGGWLLAMRGHWRIVGVIPPLLVYLIAIYGNIIGGEGAPALAFYALAILMAALIMGEGATWTMAVLSIAGYTGVGIAHLHGFLLPMRTLHTAFINRVIIITTIYTAISALLWFLVRRYRLALAESHEAAALLSEHVAKLGETNLMLEVENAERRRIQHALQESEERYRSLLNNIPDIVYSINGKGELLSVNQESLKIFGYREEEILGRPFTNIIHPDDMSLVINSFLEELRDRREYTSGVQFRILLRDGTSRWVEEHSHARFDEEGNFIQEEGVLRDITDRLKAQDALQESEERYRSLFEYSRDAIIIMEPPSWRCARVNRMALDMFRTDAGTITALGPWDLTPPLQPGGEPSEAMIRGMIDRAVAEGWCFFEWQCRRLDGSEFPATALLSRIEQSGLTFLQATVRDITERKRAEDQIKASLREKEVLLREIHHRVKNNFQIITSLLNLQSRNLSDPGLLKLFEDSTTRIRAMALVHEKLYQSNDLAEINFSSYLKTIAEDLSGTYRGILERPRLVIDADEAYLSIDQAVPCGLIVNELITNALKYAFPGESADKRLSITLRRSGEGTITIRISDNGVGLPADLNPEKIQTLGLQLVGLLTKQIHGTASLERKDGTAWTITFPMLPLHRHGTMSREEGKASHS